MRILLKPYLHRLKVYSSVKTYSYVKCAGTTQASVRKNASDICVWWTRLSDVPWQDVTELYQALIPEEELAHIYLAQEHSSLRQERLTSKVLSRACITSFLGGQTDLKSLKFGKGAHGKPFLIKPEIKEGLQYNVTHTKGMAGCIVNSSCPVGIDVELLSRRPAHLMKLAKRRLSDLEYSALAAGSNEEERAHMFMMLWTLKEAFVKCRGLGINATPGLKGFSVSLGHPLLDESALNALCSAIPALRSCHHQQLVEINLVLHGQYNDGDGPLASKMVLETSCLTTSGSEGRSPLSDATIEDIHGRHCWKFLLMQPSEEHVAAICLEESCSPWGPGINDSKCIFNHDQRLDFEGRAFCSSPTSAIKTINEGDPLVGALSSQPRPKLSFFECVPLLWERPAQLDTLKILGASEHFLST
ncbi:hypothetical protein CEUSTIGMA_g1038.t1 [Chlamydomonas eustigma]|uniref:holo-[acyl-carrier-protein] synthase n=1 Tax=Chlamydomonas eustigma TaxID=1157962 RepID=A0A250WRV8_9CHLO|nr:hypothetical protein CEUSTIGMA_g1038.t1 [Chlamydomonas eustigma]|eukprot:GAX73587.1 hypothetical protein CEUSTIGMA_g1038.t1 [Chlamydomonas eustigma]